MDGQSSGKLIWIIPGTESESEAEYKLGATETIFGMRLNLPYTFTLNDVRVTYGEPSHLIVLVNPSIDKTDDRTTYLYSVEFVYLGSGLLLPYFKHDPLKQPMILPSMEFGSIILFEANMEGLQKMRYSKEVITNQLVPWEGNKGFTYYCKKAYENDGSIPCELS